VRSILHPRTWVAAKETSPDVFVLKGFEREVERGMRSARPPPTFGLLPKVPLPVTLVQSHA
jgi:hypothetical protein